MGQSLMHEMSDQDPGFSRTSERNENVTSRPTSPTSSVITAVQAYWIATLVTNCCIVICNAWIAYAFISHSRSVLARHKVDEHNRRVYKSLIAAVLIPFARYFSTLALLVVMINPTNEACEIAIDIGKAFFILSVVSIYMFYWTRQRSFYQHSALSNTLGKKIRVASKYSLVQLLSMAFIMIPLAVYPNEYEAYPGGCIANGGHVVKNGRYYVYGISLVLAQITVLFLFSYPLIVHYKEQRRTKRAEKITRRSLSAETDPVLEIAASFSSEDDLPVTGNGKEGASDCGYKSDCEIAVASKMRFSMQEQQSSFIEDNEGREQNHYRRYGKDEQSVKAIHTTVVRVTGVGNTVRKLPGALLKRLSSVENPDKLYNVIKRTFKLSALAVISDLVTVLVAGSLLPEDTPQCIIRVVYDLDLFINVIAVIGGFQEWKRILKKPVFLFVPQSTS